jgi:ribonuclease Z
MIPKPPPKEGGLGFLFIPPFRVQGTSIAGESTCVQVPELDVCFDMGVCPRAALSSKIAAISHGHMDHIGGLAYYCSQRVFQGMGPGTILCHKAIGPAIKRMMEGYISLEEQVTPYTLVEMEQDQVFEIKNNIFIRMFEVEHTCPSSGYTIYERRSKLKPEYYELPQDKLRELKDKGVDITRILHVPLVSYIGDTSPGPWLIREEVRKSQIVIAECTFLEDDQRDRAKVGKHLHLRDIAEWIPTLECQKLVLVHLSRRTHVQEARTLLRKLVKGQHADRVEFLMDHKANKFRYERQVYEAGKMQEPMPARRAGPPRR